MSRRKPPAARQPHLTLHVTGRAGGPIVKNKLFAFGLYEKADD
jgi:hypothetical protein